MAGGAKLSPVASTYCPPFAPVTFAGSVGGAFTSCASDTSTSNAPLSTIADNSSSSSTVLGRSLSFVACDGLWSTISSRCLCFVASSGPLSAVSGRFLSLIVGNGPLSIVFGCFLSFVAGGGPLSAVSSGGLLFFVPPTDS